MTRRRGTLLTSHAGGGPDPGPVGRDAAVPLRTPAVRGGGHADLTTVVELRAARVAAPGVAVDAGAGNGPAPGRVGGEPGHAYRRGLELARRGASAVAGHAPAVDAVGRAHRRIAAGQRRVRGGDRGAEPEQREVVAAGGEDPAVRDDRARTREAAAAVDLCGPGSGRDGTAADDLGGDVAGLCDGGDDDERCRCDGAERREGEPDSHLSSFGVASGVFRTVEPRLSGCSSPARRRTVAIRPMPRPRGYRQGWMEGARLGRSWPTRCPRAYREARRGQPKPVVSAATHRPVRQVDAATGGDRGGGC